MKILGQLYFVLSQGQEDAFEQFYKASIAPILQRHGLVESSETGRPTVPGTFRRLFEFEHPRQIREKSQELKTDREWINLSQKIKEKGFVFEARIGKKAVYDYFDLIPYEISGSFKNVVPAQKGRGFWKTYDVTDGLASGQVSAIVQDKDGFMWFGTDNGLSRFDGQSWYTYNETNGLSGTINALYLDNEQKLWVGTHSGVYCYDDADFVKQGVFENVHCRIIMQDSSNRFWFGGRTGAFCLDHDKMYSFAEADGLAGEILAICEDENDLIWFGTSRGLFCYDGQHFEHHHFRDRVAGSPIRSIISDQKGHLWLCDTPQGIYTYDGNRFEIFNEIPEERCRHISSIFEDQNGVIWFGSGFLWETGGGVERYDGKTLTQFTIEDGLPSDAIGAIYQDREGHLWFGTGDGVCRYSDEQFLTFTIDEGLVDNTVSCIEEDRNGHFWLGTMRGISQYDGEIFINYTWEDGIPCVGVIYSMTLDREGCVWFGAGNVVTCYDGKIWSTYSSADGLVDGAVMSLFEDRDGTLWAGLQRGLCRFDGTLWHQVWQGDKPFKGNVQWIYQDTRGDMWFGMARGNNVSVWQFDGENWMAFSTDNGFPSSAIQWIHQDRAGDYWFVSSNGICRYDGENFKVFERDDGLANNVTWSIAEGCDGHLWFGTNGGGASRYDGQVFQTLSRKDGLVGNKIHKILEDSKGQFWFATNNGLTRFRPPTTDPPSIAIQSVVADHRYDAQEDIEILESTRLVAFEFQALSLKTRSEQLIYRYRLKGFDDTWYNTLESRVEFQDLAVGNYTFEVVAVDRDLVYSNTSATVNLRVISDPRDEQIDELEARVRERTRKLEEAYQSLQARSQELEVANHRIQEGAERKSRFLSSISHELRTPITAVKGYVDNMLDGIGGSLNERQERNLTRVSRNADHLLRLVNNLLDLSKIEAGRMGVAVTSFNVDELIDVCCDVVRPLSAEDVQLKILGTDGLKEAKTDEDKLRQILINLLSNALKFTEKGEVSILAEAVDGNLVLTVSDTGCGIPPTELDLIFEEFQQAKSNETRQKGTGLGLSITKGFVELLGGTINARSEVGKGSQFVVTLPRIYPGNLPK